MADLVLYNARIYPGDDTRTPFSAIALRGRHILALGDDATMRARLAPGGRAIDLSGRTVVPGLVDAHLHFDWHSRMRLAINVETPTLATALARVATRAAQTPAGQWLTGQGWNQSVWGLGAFPTAADLDRVAPAHPVFLTAKSGHAAWANSLALRLAGITAQTPDPAGGALERDAHGQPTGILFENAADLVARCLPHLTAEDTAAAMEAAFPEAWQAGLTGIHDFDGVRAFQAFQLLRERGALGLRVVKNIPVAHVQEALGLGLRSGFGDDWLRIGGIKVFADGALGPRTAAMLAPYEGEPENYGIVVTDKESFYETASQASAAGFSMTVHAIGDRANHDVLDVYEAVRAEEAARGVPPSARRHRIEHVQILHPSDYARLGALQVIASMQPIHATSDMLAADRYWGARSVGAYAWRTQADAGAVLAFGSDCPVEPLNPLYGIHAAVTRRRADGTPGADGWYPEQCLSVHEAVRGFTWGAAYAAGLEARLGTLTPGKLADLVVLDEDLFTVEPMHIAEITVAGTLIDGRWMWSAAGWE